MARVLIAAARLRRPADRAFLQSDWLLLDFG